MFQNLPNKLDKKLLLFYLSFPLPVGDLILSLVLELFLSKPFFYFSILFFSTTFLYTQIPNPTNATTKTYFATTFFACRKIAYLSPNTDNPYTIFIKNTSTHIRPSRCMRAYNTKEANPYIVITGISGTMIIFNTIPTIFTPFIKNINIGAVPKLAQKVGVKYSFQNLLCKKSVFCFLVIEKDVARAAVEVCCSLHF